MKNLNLDSLKAGSTRSLAAVLKNSLIANGVNQNEAHAKGWELARAIATEVGEKKLTAETITGYISEHSKEVNAITGLKGSAKKSSAKAATTSSRNKEVELTTEAKAIVSNDKVSNNEKIRSLHGLGYQPADIRKALGLKYQRVKNIVKKI